MSSARGLLARALPRLVRLSRAIPGAPGDRGRYLHTQARLEDGDRSGWEATRVRLLHRANDEERRGHHAAALAWFDKALRLAYHPTLHSTGEVSTLARDPESFLAPLRSSRTGAVLLAGDAPAPALPRPAPRDRADGEPWRLFVIAQRNWTFVDPVITALEETGRVTVRRLEVDDLPAAERPARDHVLRAARARWTDGERLPTPHAVREGYAWADTVLIEWGHHVLTWVSLLDQRPRLLTARVHRFEAYTPFPLLTDFAAVDRALFVSPHVHRMLERLAPRLAEAGTVTRVDNLLGRGLGPEPGRDHDPFLITQVGWIRPVKDLPFTLEVLDRLRRQDPRFRLRLIGPGLPEDPAQDSAHEAGLRRQLAAVGPGAVENLGVRSDVPELLSRSGWVISSSRSEGVHEAVMEGLAAGCAVVVRDWPDAAPYGGAETIYPGRWVVPDVDGAVDRISRVLAEDAFVEESRDGRAWVVARRTPQRVIDGYLRALAPEGAPG